MLPLDEDATVALCGPNADRAKLGGGGSSEVTPFAQVSPLDGLRERADEVIFKRGLAPITESSLFDTFAPEGKADESDDADSTVDSGSGSGRDLDSEASLDDAVAAAETADCVVVVVEDDTTEGEDRSTLELPGGQDTLIEQVAAAAERTVVVRRTSGPIEMSWVEDIDALLETWYPGQADGAALASVLYGDHDPGGRLPVTFGHSAAEYPTASEEVFPGVDREARYDEGVFVGYRYFDREGTDPLFPFGHGLSYAEFEYGDPAIESVGSDDTSSDTGSSPTASSAGFDTDLPVEVTVPVRKSATEREATWYRSMSASVTRAFHGRSGNSSDSRGFASRRVNGAMSQSNSIATRSPITTRRRGGRSRRERSKSPSGGPHAISVVRCRSR